MHCRWECKLGQPSWKTLWKYLKKAKNRTTVLSRHPTPGYSFKGNKTHLLKRHPLAVVLVTTATEWKQPQGPSTYRRRMTMLCVYTMEYDSATKTGISSFSTRMDLEVISLRELSRHKKTSITSSLSCVPPKNTGS